MNYEISDHSDHRWDHGHSNCYQSWTNVDKVLPVTGVRLMLAGVHVDWLTVSAEKLELYITKYWKIKSRDFLEKTTKHQS